MIFCAVDYFMLIFFFQSLDFNVFIYVEINPPSAPNSDISFVTLGTGICFFGQLEHFSGIYSDLAAHCSRSAIHFPSCVFSFACICRPVVECCHLARRTLTIPHCDLGVTLTGARLDQAPPPLCARQIIYDCAASFRLLSYSGEPCCLDVSQQLICVIARAGRVQLVRLCSRELLAQLHQRFQFNRKKRISMLY